MADIGELLSMPVVWRAAAVGVPAAFCASLLGVVLVLKSDNTVVALPDSDVYINTAGNSGLAKGGSGDVLSGVIGSLCAMGMSAAHAALLGVYLHSYASDLAVKNYSKHSITPGIVAGYISAAFTEVSEKK